MFVAFVTFYESLKYDVTGRSSETSNLWQSRWISETGFRSYEDFPALPLPWGQQGQRNALLYAQRNNFFCKKLWEGTRKEKKRKEREKEDKKGATGGLPPPPPPSPPRSIVATSTHQIGLLEIYSSGYRVWGSRVPSRRLPKVVCEGPDLKKRLECLECSKNLTRKKKAAWDVSTATN